MDFGWTDEQQRFREEVIRFAQRELDEDVSAGERDGSFSREAWKKCASFGIQGLPLPAEYGGSGADPLTIIAAMEALGYGCKDNGLLFSLNAHMWSCEVPIWQHGTEEQKRRYLGGLCDGSLIGVQAMTEPGSGSDAFAMTTTAERRGDVYLLRGSKTFITNAPIADVFVVFASTDRAAGFTGISAFIVDRETPGVVVGQPFSKMGLRTSPMSEIAFMDAEVPATALIGAEGAGMGIFSTSMDWERSFILAPAIGTMQRQLERAVEYARGRRQYRRPIGKFQAVSHRLVDMRARLEQARLLLYHLGWQKVQGNAGALDSSLVKLVISEAFVQNSMDAMQTFGAYGYMTEYELERDVRDALAGRIYSGTSDIQRNIVARLMGL